MTNLSFKKTFAGLVLATALAAGAAQAESWKHGDKDTVRSEQHWKKMTSKLALTPVQQAQMKTLHLNQRQAMQSQMEQRKKLRQEQRVAMQAPVPDRAKLEALRQQELRLHDQASKQRMDHHLAVLAILTPEQRQKMQARMQARADKYEKKQLQQSKKRKHDKDDDDKDDRDDD